MALNRPLETAASVLGSALAFGEPVPGLLAREETATVTLTEYNSKFGSGIERMRAVVKAFDGVREDFNQRFTISQLCLLHRMWCMSEWDFAPDEWAAKQVSRALRGIVPTWDADEKPTYEPSAPRWS